MSGARELGDFTARGGSTVETTRAFGDALVTLAAKDPRIIALTGDLTPATESDAFRDAFPDRFFNAGIAEANMMGMAAGMARTGNIPFVHSFAVFATRRPFDQIAMQIAYPQLPVKIIGFLPGLTTLLGVSHQAIDDVALMRALPNMTILEPGTPADHASAIGAAVEHGGPVYLRISRSLPRLDLPATPWRIGEASVLREGTDISFLAAGHGIAEALAAADTLASEGISVSVTDMRTLKPLDEERVLMEARRTGRIVTVENHSIIGGLGSAVAETLMEAGTALQFRRIGVRDRFAEGGSTPYLFDRYGLSAPHIVKAARTLLV